MLVGILSRSKLIVFGEVFARVAVDVDTPRVDRPKLSTETHSVRNFDTIVFGELVRLTEGMDKSVNSIAALLTGAGVVVAIVVFAATQQPTARDWVGAVLGLVVGMVLVGGAWVLASRSKRSEQRKASIEAERQARLDAIQSEGEATEAAILEYAREQTEGLRIENAARAEGIAEQNRLKAELIEVLPTRSERLKELRERASSYRKAVVMAQAAVGEQQEQAKSALQAGFRDMAAGALGAAEVSRLEAAEYAVEAEKVEEELAEIDAMTDDAYLERVKHLRGLD